jgi:hypothetical protein
MGIDAAGAVAGGGPRVWLSITGYGRHSNRVAFGDDAAAAGGLVAWDDDGAGPVPCFVADAIADPLTGVAAAAGMAAALADGRSWMLEARLSGVAAHVAGDDRCRRWTPDDRLVAAPPQGPGPGPPASALGADNDAVGRRLGLALG